MQDKPTPKFKTSYVVYDRELSKEYLILKFNNHQLNGDVWYTAKDTLTGEVSWVCEKWLILIRKYKPAGLSHD